TNHLDLDARQALIDALNAFDGAIVLVSHDPRIVAACADQLWLVAEGTCRQFVGDLDDYRRQLAAERRAERREAAPAREREGSRKEDRRAAAETRARLAPLRQAARAAEDKLERLHREKLALEARLADPALYAASAQEVTAINRALGEIKRSL